MSRSVSLGNQVTKRWATGPVANRKSIQLCFDPELGCLVTEHGDVIANVVNVEITYDMNGSSGRVEFSTIPVLMVPFVPEGQVEETVSGLKDLEQRLSENHDGQHYDCGKCGTACW